MLTIQPTPDALNQILALQIRVAWAGESPDGAPRLNWWRTDIVDEGAGGYLLQELMPRTYRWASLEAVRGAAIQADRQSRSQMAQPDRVRTLFFWGFGLDEQLADLLRSHKQSQSKPDAVLALDVSGEFSKDDFERTIRRDPAPKYKVVPSGRQMMGPMPEACEVCAAQLAAALLPLTEHYTMPFYAVEE